MIPKTILAAIAIAASAIAVPARASEAKAPHNASISRRG